MAKTRVKGSGGGLTMISGINADWASYTLESSQQVEDTSSYTDPAGSTSASGSGVTGWTASVAGFLNYGATGTAPGFAALSGDGASATFTMASGCTWVGNWIVERMSVAARKIAGAIAVTGSMRSTGAITETWATS